MVASWAACFKAITLLYQHRYDEAAVIIDRHKVSWATTPLAARTVALTVSVVEYLRGRHRDALEQLGGEEMISDVWAVAEEVVAAVIVADSGNMSDARSRMRVVAETVRRGGWHPLARHDCLVGLAILAAIEGECDRASRMIATVTSPSTPPLGILLRHHREYVHDQLERETRKRCIEEGRAMSVDEAIDLELGR